MYYDRKSARAGESRGLQWGLCRRDSPRLNPVNPKMHAIEGVWPTVRDDDWCGRWHAQARRATEPVTSGATLGGAAVSPMPPSTSPNANPMAPSGSPMPPTARPMPSTLSSAPRVLPVNGGGATAASAAIKTPPKRVPVAEEACPSNVEEARPPVAEEAPRRANALEPRRPTTTSEPRG
jgi:hypothetical protein